MKSIELNIEKALGTVSKSDVFALENKAKSGMEMLHKGTGKGNDFLGWLHLPSEITEAHLADLEAAAKQLKDRCEIVVVIGIGGSYLGAKAVIEALSDSFEFLRSEHKNPLVLFAGHNIGEDYLFELQTLLKNKSFGIVVISKSGTTTEPAIAFRLLKEQLEAQVGKDEAKHRIIAITDAKKGALRKLADTEGYKTFVIADNVGGRFSVLTPVGLLPIAIAGFDIRTLVSGAVAMEKACGEDIPFEKNPAAIYAATRNALYQSGKKIEILGIYPASVDFTTDLHSMGQWIQEGERTIFETVLSVAQMKHTVNIPSDKDNLDGLNFLSGKRVDEVNKMAELGTQIAHVDGGVPNLKIEIPELSELYLGQLIYFFEKACGISGYILGVNPFNQPGVEAYKRNMFALLNKPGYEEESKAIQARI